MADQQRDGKTVFRVVDAMDAPHGGRILRLRLIEGKAPSIKSLKGARLLASSPDGRLERWVNVQRFALFGGRKPEKRLTRDGRVDVQVEEEGGDEGSRVGLQWTVQASP
jgi:hypothetical protein